MKLITWNCQGAFRKKAAVILKEKPSILVVPECENLDKLVFGADTPKPTNSIWVGDNPHKGLGVFSYGKYRLQQLPHNPEIKYVVPIEVTDGKIKYVLFAIWANHRTDPEGQYVEQVWKGIHYYEEHLSSAHVLLAGDFNSNTIWDRKSRIGNHSDVVDRLEAKGIHSVYHQEFSQEQGKEAHPTFFLYKNRLKPYHLDYCFASASLSVGVKSVKVGTYDEWIPYSDHVPLAVTF